MAVADRRHARRGPPTSGLHTLARRLGTSSPDPRGSQTLPHLPRGSGAPSHLPLQEARPPHPALWWHRGSFSRPAALQGCRGWALGLGPPPRAEVSPLWMPQEADAAPPLQSESLPDPQRGSGASLPTLDMVPDCGLPPPASLLSSWVPPSQGAAWHSLTENSYCRFKPLSIC